MQGLTDLRIQDIATFLAVCRYGSFGGAARELRVTASQVSKAIDRLSTAMRQPLVTRSGRGIIISDEGRRLLPQLDELLSRLRLMQQGNINPIPELVVAAPSYLIAHFLPYIAAGQPTLRVRGIELAPAHIRAYATERFFDVTMTDGIEQLPDTWVSSAIGPVRKALFASPALAARLRPFPTTVDRLEGVPFISPVYLSNGQIVPGEDGCPLPRSERRLGSEVDTLRLGLALATRTEQLVFGPALSAQSYVERGLLLEVPVREWNVVDKLYLACHEDRVMSNVQKVISDSIRGALDELES